MSDFPRHRLTLIVGALSIAAILGAGWVWQSNRASHDIPVIIYLVDTLRKDVQLVIITHQQQTMHAADVLNGVTMEPGGSSQVISKRMTPVTV